MDNYMKNNFNNDEITQYFCDCTYYCVPPQNKKMKLFELLAFDNNKKKHY